MRSVYFLAAVAAFSATKAFGNEQVCLARILHAESRGESLEGLIAVGQAAMTRADDQDTNLCDVQGVQRSKPKTMGQYYLALAKELIQHPSTSVSKGADSWNTGDKPAHPGKVTRHIDNHTFYIMSAKGEK